MSRGRKLLVALIVLVVGFGLAWPFHKTPAQKARDQAETAVQVDVSRPPTVANQQSHGNSPFQQEAARRGRGTAVGSPLSESGQLPPRAPHVVAKMTSLGDANGVSTASQSTASFDLANHPALVGPPAAQNRSPVTPPIPLSNQAPLKGYLPTQMQPKRATARPVYATTDPDYLGDSPQQHAREVRHVVQNSDTLEKLAKRYLGDEGRALEIFDLNRDVLDNPLLLPIDAQLRIPTRARKSRSANK